MAKRMKLFIPLMLMISILTGCFGGSSNPSPNPEVKADVYYLFIGVSDYLSEKISPLKGCVNDALSFKQMLINNQNTISSLGSVLVSDGDIKPTKNNIKKSIYNLLKNADEDATFIFTFSGHGVRDIVTRTEYIVPYDAQYIGDGLDAQSLISDQELKLWIEEIDPNRCPNTCIFVIDSCHSAGMIKGKTDSSYNKSIFLSTNTPSIMARNLSEINNGKNIIAMAAADLDQSSWDVLFHDNKFGGLFSTFLIEGISKIDDIDYHLDYMLNIQKDYPANYNSYNIITVEEAFNYAKNRVREYQWCYKISPIQEPYIYYSNPLTNDTPLFYIP